jgi:ketosteroid isomerase-like protein
MSVEARDGDWIETLFERLDAGDVDGFCTPLSEEASFVFANRDPVQGRDQIYAYVEGFLGAIEGTDHRLDEVHIVSDRAIVRGEVTYTRLDGTTLSVPFANIFEMEGDEIATYQIYVDNTEL